MRGDEPIDKSMRRKLHKLHGKLRKTIHHMGDPAKKAIENKSGKVQKKAVHFLSESERKEKIKNWPKASGKAGGMKAQMGRSAENRAFQAKTGRAWND